VAAVSLLGEKQKIQKQQQFTGQIWKFTFMLFTNNLNVLQEMCEECIPLIHW